MQLVATKPSIPSMKLERLIKRQKQRDTQKNSVNDSDGELFSEVKIKIAMQDIKK